ncbi:MAG: NUDIX domain-containing protein [Phycisphaerae bacterium]
MARNRHVGGKTVHGAIGVLFRSGRFLLIRRAEEVRAGGKWCFPGGGVEPGETSSQAVVREMAEEVGLTVRAVEQLWRSSRQDGDGRLVLDWWRVEALAGRVKPDPAEVAEARWVTADQIRANPDILPGMLEFLNLFESAGY